MQYFSFWRSFNGHPPLGVNATPSSSTQSSSTLEFQWAPTLGGECYRKTLRGGRGRGTFRFNGHPPLGVNATEGNHLPYVHSYHRFNGHPPLGVNATSGGTNLQRGECSCFNGHPPLGVNATCFVRFGCVCVVGDVVSMGTHPWG